MLQVAFDSLGQGIGPALEQIREAAPDGSPVQEQINVALAAVANLYGALGNAVASQRQQQQAQQQQQHQHARGHQGDCGSQDWGDGATRFHIGDGWACEDDGWGHWGRAQDYDSGGGYGGWGDDGGWQETGWEQTSAAAHPTGGEGGMDTTEARGPKWMRRAEASQADHGARSWKKGRTSEGDAGPSSQDPEAQAVGGATGGGQAAGSGDAGALQRAEGGAEGAPGGASGSVGPGADEEALAARREEVLKQAVTDGIDTKGLPPAEAGMAALEKWAKDNLL